MGRIKIILVIAIVAILYAASPSTSADANAETQLVSLKDIPEADLERITRATVDQAGALYKSAEAAGRESILPISKKGLNRILAADRKIGLSYFILDANHNVRGFVLAQEVVKDGKSVVEIEKFGVDSAFQRSGYGKTLMEAVTRKAQTLKADHIELLVRNGNSSAIGFYERAGFGRPAQAQADIPEAWGAQRMVKKLSSATVSPSESARAPTRPSAVQSPALSAIAEPESAPSVSARRSIPSQPFGNDLLDRMVTFENSLRYKPDAEKIVLRERFNARYGKAIQAQADWSANAVERFVSLVKESNKAGYNRTPEITRTSFERALERLEFIESYSARNRAHLKTPIVRLVQSSIEASKPSYRVEIERDGNVKTIDLNEQGYRFLRELGLTEPEKIARPGQSRLRFITRSAGAQVFRDLGAATRTLQNLTDGEHPWSYGGAEIMN